MRAKKRVLIISSVAALLSMVIFTVALICGDSNSSNKVVEWVKTVSAGILTSALVTLFAYIGEYRVEKVAALEKMYEASDDLTNQYRGLRALYTEIPLDLLKPYFNAVMFQSPYEPNLTEKPKQDIIGFLWAKLPESEQKRIEADGKAEEYREQRFQAAIRSDKTAIDNIIKQYLDLAERIGTKNLTSAYGNIDFIFVNTKRRQKFLYDKIYKKHLDMQDRIYELVYHLRVYMDAEEKNRGRGNLSAVISKISDVEKHLFEEKHHWNNMETVILKHFVYDMDCQSHELLRYAYGKRFSDPEPDEKRYRLWWRYENPEDYQNDEEEEE